MPKCDNFGFPDSETLDPLMYGLGDPYLSNLNKVDTASSESANFYNPLNAYITSGITNATILFDFHFQYETAYYIQNYSFW